MGVFLTKQSPFAPLLCLPISYMWQNLVPSSSGRSWHGCVPYQLWSLQLCVWQTCLYLLWWGKSQVFVCCVRQGCGAESRMKRPFKVSLGVGCILWLWAGGWVVIGSLFSPFQNTKHYELLNYSEHGTTVDNVLYSCDFSEKTALVPPSSLVAKVQSVISKP